MIGNRSGNTLKLQVPELSGLLLITNVVSLRNAYEICTAYSWLGGFFRPLDREGADLMSGLMLHVFIYDIYWQ